MTHMICSILICSRKKFVKSRFNQSENFTIVSSISSRFLAIINAPINKEASYQSFNFIMKVYLKLVTNEA